MYSVIADHFPQTIQCAAQDAWSQHQSQLGADRWVLESVGSSRFYLDVGANHGQLISNTFLLDKVGWRGICVEPIEQAGYEDRTCIVEREVVGSERGQQVEFQIATQSVLSGAHKFLGVHKNVASTAGSKVMKNTTLLQDILVKHNAPTFIDFLSLDTEGSEFEILKSFPLDTYFFGHIAVEHNMEEPKRSNIQKLLLGNGYELQKEVEFDDWYVRRGCV